LLINEKGQMRKGKHGLNKSQRARSPLCVSAKGGGYFKGYEKRGFVPPKGKGTKWNLTYFIFCETHFCFSFFRRGVFPRDDVVQDLSQGHAGFAAQGVFQPIQA